MYAIHATEQRTTADGYTSTRQIPTFYLHENVQGIVSESHARAIALDILGPREGSLFHVTAIRTENR